jgi:hypothetical protein
MAGPDPQESINSIDAMGGTGAIAGQSINSIGAMGGIGAIAGVGQSGAIGASGGIGAASVQPIGRGAGAIARGVHDGRVACGAGGGGIGRSCESASIAGTANIPVITINLYICVISIILTTSFCLSEQRASRLARALAIPLHAL